MMKRILLLSCLALLAVAGRMQAQCVTVDGIEYTVDTDGQTATVTGYTGIPVDVVIPATVTIDGTDYAVTSIGFDAFYNCDALQSVVLPEGLRTIGCNAFNACFALESTVFPESLQTIGGCAFTRCISLQSIALPESLQSIGGGAFWGCTALRSVTLPEALQSIGGNAFAGCTALQSIALSEDLQSIGENAFSLCPLQYIACHAATPPAIHENTFSSDTYVTATLTVPQGAGAAYRVAEGWELFYASILENGIIYVAHSDEQSATVFSADLGITAAHIPVMVNINGKGYPVTTIGKKAFYQCDVLQSVTFSETLQSIGEFAFGCCFSLQSVVLPEGLQTIDEGTFIDCNELQSVTFSETLQSIGEWAFAGCFSLQSVTLPEGLQSIGNCAFLNCSSLQNIALPSTLQRIMMAAFSGCPLTDVYCHASTPPAIEEDTFDVSTYTEATLHVPSDVANLYRSAEYWKQFQHIEGDLPSTAISSVATDASLAIYANGILTTESPAAITVYAQNGAVVRHAADATSLSLAGLPRGIYIICVAQGGQRQVMKVIH